MSAEAKQAESIVTQVTGVAESALLVPVGCRPRGARPRRGRDHALDQPASAEREIGRVRRDVRRFERRGTVARNRVVRELRKRRNRVVRELRKRRGQALRVGRLSVATAHSARSRRTARTPRSAPTAS